MILQALTVQTPPPKAARLPRRTLPETAWILQAAMPSSSWIPLMTAQTVLMRISRPDWTEASMNKDPLASMEIL